MKIRLYHCHGPFGRQALVLNPDATDLPSDLIGMVDQGTEITVASDAELSLLAGHDADLVWIDLLTRGWYLIGERAVGQPTRVAIAHYQRASTSAPKRP